MKLILFVSWAFANLLDSLRFFTVDLDKFDAC